jgi:hypothetical protein
MPYTIATNSERISGAEVRYWKKMFLSNLKIGVEIETNMTSGTGSEHISFLQGKLNPTNNPSRFGKYGVYAVKSDGSLTNGVELCTVGRRVNFTDLYYQYKLLIKLMQRGVPDNNDRCGLHNHVLLDYGTEHDSLEKPVPQIIMKNFIQLVKSHLPELVWLTSTVKEDDRHRGAVTRREQFCTAEDMLDNPIGSRSIASYKEYAGTTGTRYCAVNMRPLKTSGNNITTFHFELRFPDGSLYPAQIASQNILYGAMLLKAIELSEFGMINLPENFDEVKALYRALRNEGYSDNRMSIAPPEDNIPKYKTRANVFVDSMKSCIEHYDDKTYHLLKMLAEKPISMMRREMTDDQINEFFETTVNSMWRAEDPAVEHLKRMIVLQENTGAPSMQAWVSGISAKSGTSAEEFQTALFKLGLTNRVEFDMVLGTPVIK